MRWRPAQLLTRVPGEDAALAQVRWPPAVDAGAPLVGLGLTVAAGLTAVFFTEAGTPVDAVGVALLAAAAVPWLVAVLAPGDGRSPGGARWLRRRCPVEYALVPLGVLNLAASAGAVDLGNAAAYQLALFPVLVLAVLVVVSRPRRRAAVVTVVAYGVVVAGIAAASRQLGQIDWTGLVAWQAAVLLTVAAAGAVRVSALAIRRQAELVARQRAEEERRHVARDVHDVVAHTLAVTMLHITAARMAVDRGAPAEAAEALEEAERQGQASLADIRRIVRLLRADGEERGSGPQPRLADVDVLVDAYRAAGLPVEVAVSGRLDGVPDHAGLALYRVLQEALTNAARHGCGPATVALQVERGAVVLDVANPVTAGVEPGARGSGLRGMGERVAAAGGSLQAGPDGGRWRVHASVPTSPAGDRASLPPPGVTTGEARELGEGV